ncbi:D-alanyl-D-alanine carboxypeptidase [Algoriphagus sp. CAU 1675]|uniref:D-alanyl-D-alanine carboxypeptidase n=1 Tax=Algoriphagus sp. CAU 1675 TaxID=3032597 RepID=UPI0023DB4CA3|nr:D-alanyl-D-alanine carboxypeptidase [Algoriphagus sp. CAU 1675]MDF2159345.1 D-alanyl-D-alanine carboxypeptidase [Algoriphagus sp. CAU 1675]
MKTRLTRLFYFSFLFLILQGKLYAQISREQYTRLESSLGEQSFFNGHLTGFVLYDLDSQRVMFEKNSQMRFTPASVTKLFTLYSSLFLLQDSTQTLRYVEAGDTLKIWGAGDPSWKYLDLYQPNFDSLLAPYSIIQFSDANLKSKSFGEGWQWDDYLYSYSAERSSLPIYGNLVEIKKNSNSPRLFPEVFQASLYKTKQETKDLEREVHSNNFYYNPLTYRSNEKFIPFITSSKLFIELASQATGKTWIYSPEPLPKNHQLWRGAPLFPILKEMMLESDNFLAEQLMYMVSDKLFQEINTERAIEYIVKTYLYDLPDKPIWVDGSGLSRYNLFTPRTMVGLFEKINQILPREKLLELLPTGGVSGTLENNYLANQPYIFAKTGTMSNNHSLVGLIKAKSGKTYCFAFMNSNYPYKASELRREMEKVLISIRDMF